MKWWLGKQERGKIGKKEEKKRFSREREFGENLERNKVRNKGQLWKT